MSADKRKGLARRMVLLQRALRRGYLVLHVEGGMSAANRDLRRCVSDGLMEVRRDPGIPKWSKKFKSYQGRTFIATPMIRRTRVYLTETGKAKAEFL